jgi:hypothetical protein
MPNLTVTYNENLNGKSGWTFQADQDYIKKLRSSSTIDNNILDKAFSGDKNTFTIYVEKGMINNPLDIVNMDVSTTRRIIRENGEYKHHVPMGGNVRSWVGSDGQTIYMQMNEGAWRQDAETKEWNYKESVGDVVALPGGDESKIDEMMRTSEEWLTQLANENRIIHEKNTK